MKTTSQQLKKWIRLAESEHLEFKQASRQFDSEKLTRYCVVLDNEGGGKLIWGVTDQLPRQVAGTEAFPGVGKTQAQLLDRLHLRIDVEEMFHPDGRIVIVHVPSRPIGRPVEYRGAYWMRSHDALVPMTPEKLQQIFAEAEPDFSAQICKEATIGDLDHHAIETFRKRWHRRSGDDELLSISSEQLLEDAELLVDGGVTYAALILLGTRKALGIHLAQAEAIFEYRSKETSLPFQQRKEYRKGFSCTTTISGIRSTFVTMNINTRTAAKLIQSRAEYLLPNMGLTSWKVGEVRKTDVTTAKNYLNEEEIDELNRIVVMWLDFSEDQAKRRKQVFMKDWEQKLDEFLRFNERKVLPNAGKVSKQDAEGHAKAEYERFEILRRAYKESIGKAETIKQLEEAAKESKQQGESRGPSDKEGSQ